MLNRAFMWTTHNASVISFLELERPKSLNYFVIGLNTGLHLTILLCTFP
jgi:hypothetical protein